jgi:hypothetical protein
MAGLGKFVKTCLIPKSTQILPPTCSSEVLVGDHDLLDLFQTASQALSPDVYHWLCVIAIDGHYEGSKKWKQHSHALDEEPVQNH